MIFFSNPSSQLKNDHKCVHVTRRNINDVSTKGFALLEIGDKIDLLTSSSISQTPFQGSTSSPASVLSSASLSSLLRSNVLELTSLVRDLALDSFLNRNIIDRMHSDMPDISFYLKNASDYLISVGAAEYSTSDSFIRPSSSPDGTIEQIKSLLLQHHSSAQWRGCSRGRGLRGHLSGQLSQHRDSYHHINYLNNSHSHHKSHGPSSSPPFGAPKNNPFCNECTACGHHTGPQEFPFPKSKRMKRCYEEIAASFSGSNKLSPSFVPPRTTDNPSSSSAPSTQKSRSAPSFGAGSNTNGCS